MTRWLVLFAGLILALGAAATGTPAERAAVASAPADPSLVPGEQAVEPLVAEAQGQ